MTGCCSPRTDRDPSGGVGGRVPADPRMRYPRIFWVDYEEGERTSETDESSEDTMELRCRKRQKLEHTGVNGPSALSPADGHTPSSFCYDDDTLGTEKGSTDGCVLLDFTQFKHNSGLNNQLPKAPKQSGITSPKNPDGYPVASPKNGWLSQRNGCRGILLSCSNGLTASIVNGFAPVSNHVDACCRTSGSRAFCAGGILRCGTTKIADADDTAENLSSLPYVEPTEEKASQPSKSPDVVAGSRSERALDAGDELSPTGVWPAELFQQPEDLREFGILCKETVSSSSPSLSSASSSAGVRKEGTRCQWNGCGKDVEFDALLEHIARVHIDCQAATDKDSAEETRFVCLWSGCKFHGRGSVLKTWLERHIHCHLGDKPYRCIVAQCRMRFASQVLLNRHINGHFSGLQSRALRKGDLQQKKKKLKNTRPCPVKKTDDFFDSATMESIQSELVRCAQVTQVDQLHSGNTITFQSCTMAKRVNSSGQQETLLRWWPKNMLPDEWVPESRVALHATRVIPLSRLPSNTLRSLAMPPQSHRIACHHRRPCGKRHRK